MRYEEYNHEEHHRRNDNRHHQRQQEPWQERRFHDARSRWEEPATPHDLRRNAWQPEQERSFKTEGQFHQQQNQHRGQQHHDHRNQQQHRDWQQHEHRPNRNNIQQATDRWQEHDWRPQQHSQERNPFPPDQYWNEQSI